MVRLLVGVDDIESSAQIADYLNETCDEDDRIYVVNSLPGGDETTTEEIAEGKDAIGTVKESLDHVNDIDTQQFVRGNAPVEDLMLAADEWDADEFVIGVQKRSAIGQVLFGSTAQNVLLDTARPVRAVPLVEKA